MYTQTLFAMPQRDELLAVMRSYPLATVCTQTPGGAEANLLPLEITQEGGHVLLRGHVAKAHSLWSAPLANPKVLVVFQSPNAYLSPRWYVNGQRSGRLAPSWNYVAVQARGTLQFKDDGAWLVQHLATLTASQEAQRASPWSLQDASPEFVQEAQQRLIGFEIEIQDLSGKRFLSQQRTEADRRSVIQYLGLEKSGQARDLASLIVP